MITFDVPVTVRLNDSQIRDARAAVNLALFGQADVNEYDGTGRLVSKPMPASTAKAIEEIHYGLVRTKQIMVRVTLDPSTGVMSYTFPED